MKKNIILFFILFPFFIARAESPGAVGETSIIVSPSVIDEKCEARDLLEYQIKIKNDSDGRKTLYAFVNDISPENGIIEYNDPIDLDLTTSLTRWIEFRRAVIELAPGEEIEMPLKIKVNQDAKPGRYHARIVLGRGSDQYAAKDNVSELNETELLINLEVQEHVVEKVEIAEFKPKKGIFTSQPISFSLKLKNIGNQEIVPSGEVIVYNKRGKEISSIEFNEANKPISAGTSLNFPASLDTGSGFGKFKARLRVEYGSNKSDLEDTVYFIVLPRIVVIILTLIILGIVTYLAYTINKKRKEEIEKISKKENLRVDLNNNFKVGLKTDLREVPKRKEVIPEKKVQEDAGRLGFMKIKKVQENKVKENNVKKDNYIINLRSK